MNSAIIRVFAILCLSITITNCETSKQSHDTETHKQGDFRKIVDIDIKNDDGGLKISLPTGDIYVPSERKNVHIKTIDVFEEKNPMTQSDESSMEEEYSDENEPKTRSKKPMYGPQIHDNPQAFYYVPNYRNLQHQLPMNMDPYQIPTSNILQYPYTYQQQQQQQPYQQNYQFFGNNAPQPYLHQVPMSTGQYHTPTMNHPQYPYAYQPGPINLHPQQLYNQQTRNEIQEANNNYPYNQQTVQEANKNPFFNNLYSLIKGKTNKQEGEGDNSNPVFNYFSSLIKGNTNDQVEDNSAALRNNFQLIAKNVLRLISNFYNFTLPPVTYQLIDSLSRFLVP